ncbi:unnamed protein product [Schistosoma margrebowiei]|uniref:Uncharacterized protein n=1 Tax=Schistosoma margrebowiei TaxID=48269 RepID=A0A183LXJ3_9TREM|nr:unnamed protein product [Schistosoma margrebowiei]
MLEPSSYVALELLFTLTPKSPRTLIFSKLIKDLKKVFGTRKQGEKACSFIKPKYGIAATDVKLFKELLLKISSVDVDKSGHSKKREMNRLQAQISVQRQLELANPCSHNGLTLKNEKQLMELQAKEQTLHINTLPSFYKFRGTTKSVTNFSTITFTCIDFLQRDVPSIEMLSVNKQIDTAYYFEKEQSKCALTINTVVEKINISSPRTLRSSTKAQEYDLSVNKLDPTEVLSDTDDELRIDLDERNSDDHR